MKTKIIKIDNVEYINKCHYDKLKEKKTKIIKEKPDLDDFIITTPISIWGLFPMKRLNDIEKKTEVKYFHHNEREVGFLYPKDKTDKYPRIKIKNSIYNYEYFINAMNVINALGIDKEYKIMMANADDKPCILVFGEIGVIISPRVEEE